MNPLTELFRGERGIRTPGASQHGGFQDRCNRPLYHLSLSALKSGAKVVIKIENGEWEIKNYVVFK